MSVEYYAKLERGNLAGVSPAVLESLARALRLDDAERAHLLNLAQTADVHATPGDQANLARFNLLDPASHRFYPDWEQAADIAADIAVAILRTEAGRDPQRQGPARPHRRTVHSPHSGPGSMPVS